MGSNQKLFTVAKNVNLPSFYPENYTVKSVKLIELRVMLENEAVHFVKEKDLKIKLVSDKKRQLAIFTLLALLFKVHCLIN